MQTFILLDPHERAQLVADYLQTHPLPAEVDFIEAFTGHPNLTHAWNEYGLKVEVVEKILLF